MEFSENQKKAISFYKGCCNVIASAGSGKTSVLVHRIKNLVLKHGVDPNKILAITFSKKAKENMMERLENLLPEYYKYLHIETFHSFGYSLIRKFNRVSYTILDCDWKKNQIIKEIFKDQFGSQVNGSDVYECSKYISMQKNHLVFPMKKYNRKADDFEIVYYYYEKYKKEHNFLDFDDMLTIPYEILTSNQKALEYCQSKFEFILADEMQDTNTAQYQILKLISQKNQNIFFVDDPLQNIFMWRGSDNKYVLDFDEEWENNPTTINLNCNYRSSNNIVQLANKFAKTIPESKHKHYIESVANNDDFKSPVYQMYLSEKDEAEHIAEKILEIVKSNEYSYKDIAILSRTNSQLLNFESAMYKYSIPYHVVDGIPFVERKEIKIILSYLRLAQDMTDDEAFIYIYNKPNRYLGKQFLDEVKKTAIKNKTSMFYSIREVAQRNKKYYRGVHEIISVVDYLSKMNLTVKNQIIYLRKKLNIDDYVSEDSSDDNNSSDKSDNLNTLENNAENYSSTKEFIDYMGALAVTNSENDNVVRLMTIHKSKGLEYPVVFIVGVNENILPHRRNENVDEERRLMYVAITRAEKELYISSTSEYLKRKSNQSIFIDELFKN